MTGLVTVLVTAGCADESSVQNSDARDELRSLASTLCASSRAVLSDAAQHAARDTTPDPFGAPLTEESSAARAFLDSLREQGFVIDGQAMLRTLSHDDPSPSFLEMELHALPISASAPLVGVVRILYGPFLPDRSLPFAQHNPGEELVLHLEILALWRHGYWDRRNLQYSTLFLNRNTDLWQAASTRKARFLCSSIH